MKSPLWPGWRTHSCVPSRHSCRLLRQSVGKNCVHTSVDAARTSACATLRTALAITLLTLAAQAQDIVPWVERKAPRPDLLKKVAFDQKLNAQLPLDVPFRDEAGRTVPLGTYFHKKPVVLSLAYYECPMLCTLALNGQLRAYRALDFTAGNEFEVVTISINPREGPVLAAAKKASYLEKYRRQSAAQGWHFLTGPESSIRAVANAVGFHYEYDPVSKQYAHATGLIVLTPEGRVARYQYGVEYSAQDLRLALLEASANRIGSPADKILLYCFHYDPATGKYSMAILNLVRAGAVATFIGLFTFIVAARRRRRAGFSPRGTTVPLLINALPLWPTAASSMARNVDALFIFEVTTGALVTLLIFALILFFGIRYRRRSPDERPRPIHGNIALEALWSGIPLIIFLIFFFWGASIFYANANPPRDAMQIYVVGKQWMWYVQHPGGQREINEVHLPAGRNVQFILTSQDVIHSFYMPAFRIKKDAVPGMYTTQWVRATNTGAFHLFCAEYCGTSHSRMTGTIYVMSPADYEQWLTGAVGGDTMAQAGAKLYQRLGCVNCHGVIAPNLNGLYMKGVGLADGRVAIADDAYLRESILDPGAKVIAGYPNIMPSFQGEVSEEGVLQLIAYIKSLGTPALAGPGAGIGSGQGAGRAAQQGAETR